MTDANMTPVPTVPKTARGIKIALAVSVAINLAVAGVVGGLALNGGPGGRGDRMVREVGFGPFDAALSPQDRMALRRTVVSRLGDFRAMRLKMQDDLIAVVAALRSDPYDPAAMSAAFDAQANRLSDRLKQGNLLIRDYLLALTPEARLDFADRLDRALKHGPERDDMTGGKEKGG